MCVAKGDQVDIEGLVTRLVEYGYRREYQVEHRGEVAVRGSIVDVFPATADRPVRIDLWGDEVDRLTEFSVTDQRTTDDVDAVEILPCRELLPTAEVREPGRGAHRSRALGSRAVGAHRARASCSTAWSRGCRGWRRRSACWPTCCPTTPRSCWSSPAACGTAPPTSWPRRPTWPRPWPGRGARSPTARPTTSRRCTCPSTGSSSHATAATWHLTTSPEGPDTPTVQAMTFQVAVGRRGPPPRPAARPARRRLPHRHRRRRRGLGRPPARAACPTPASTPRSSSCPSSGAASCPACALALLAEADLTGRRRSHRKARPRRRDAQKFFDDLQVGDHVVHHQHGVARYGGMVKRAIGGVERDYLLLEYRDGDKLYVPSDQIDAVRHYTGGDTPSPHPPRRRLVAEGQDQGALGGPGDRPGARRALPEAPRRRRPRLRRRHAVAAAVRGRLPLRADPRPAASGRGHQGRHGDRVPDGPPRRRRRRLRQDRGRPARRLQGDPGRQAGRGAGPHHAARPAALPDVLASASPTTRSGSRCCPASSPPARPRP